MRLPTIAPLVFRSRGFLFLAALVLLGAASFAQTDSPRRQIFTNSLAPVPPGGFDAVQPLRAEHLADTLEIEVPLKMRDYPKLIARVGHRETLTPDDLAQNYLPLARDYELVERWLSAQGFEVSARDPNHLSIFARGTLAQIQSALQVQMAKVTVRGVVYSAAQTHPSLPVNIAAPVLGINGLQPFLKPHKHLVHPAPAINNAPPYLVKEVLGAYNGTTLGVTGNNQTIAILIDSVPTNSDLTNFWSKNGITQSISNITKIGVTSTTLITDTDGEATLDTEWSSSVAPNAKVRIYATGELSFTDIDKALQKIVNDLPSQPTMHVLTISLGLGETYLAGSSETTTESQYFATLAAQGVSVFVASGDAGSNPDDTGHNSASDPGPLQVEYESSDPSVTGVGGTNLTLTSTGAVSSETAWSGSGGGASQVFSRPTWQKGTGVPSGTFRLVPDVALVASGSTPAYLYFQGAAEEVAGTSWATPTWAGFAAPINEARANNSLAPLGLLNPLIYPLIGTTNFRDITSGNNGAYSAGVGYDRVTGIGVPNLANLVNALAGAASAIPTITGFSPNSGAPGDTITLTGTNFNRVTDVQFNGISAASFTASSATSITAVVPTGASTGPITAVSSSGTATSTSDFTVVAPTPANDNFANAQAITNATTTGTNVGASVESGEPEHAGNAGGHSVWYSWTAPSSGVFTFDTFGSNFDTLLAIYTGTSVSALTSIASDDDAGTGVQSSVSFVATEGTVYDIAVDGHNGQTGSITLHWTQNTGAPTINSFAPSTGSEGTLVVMNGANFTGATAVQFDGVTAQFTVNSTTSLSATVPTGAQTGVITVVTPSGTVSSAAVFTVVNPPANDNFANAQVLPGENGSVTGSNIAATKESGEPNHAGDPGGHSVWYSWIAPSSEPVTFNTFGSSFDTLLAVYTGSAVNALTQVAADSNTGSGLGSTVTFNATSGTVYEIAVDGAGGETGNIVLNYTTNISLPEITSFTPTSGAPGSQVTVSGNGFGSALAVSFNGTAATFTSSSNGQLTATVPAGATTGPITVTNPAGPATSAMAFTVSGPPGNDDFANAFTVTGTVTGRNDGATKEAGEPDHAGNAGGASVWWNWTAPANGQFTVTTLGSTFDTLLAVYTGSAVNALTVIASNDDDPSGGTTSLLTFTAVAGTQYHIAVDGYGGATGQIVLSVLQDAAGTIFSTGFESAEGYVAGQTLKGQNGWLAQGNGPNGVVSNYLQGLGQQGFLGNGSSNQRLSPTTFVWQPLNYSPGVGDIVTFQVTMQIVDSTNRFYDDFAWSVFNRNGDNLFSVHFDNLALRIGYSLDNNQGIQDTGFNFDNESIYILVVTMDFANNVWSASVDGTSIVSNQQITTSGATRDLGDIDATWNIESRPGNNYMLFDNYTVRNTGNEKPQILLQPQDQATVTGNDATFRVVATGSQPLTYQWHKGSTAISGATSSTLLIQNAQVSDAGSYNVTVANTVGTLASSNAALQVQTITAPNLLPTNVFVSRSPSATTGDTHLLSTDTLYVSYSVANNGNATAPGGFRNSLYVDGVLQDAWTQVADLAAGDSVAHDGVSIGTLSAGAHQIEVTADSGDDVGESNEADNSVTQSLTVISASSAFTIAATAAPTAGGTIAGTGAYLSGDKVTLVATPNAGYTFLNWTDGTKVASTSATYTFTATANRTLVANFALTSSFPSIAIATPVSTGSYATVESTVALSGTASDSGTVSKVTWSSNRGGAGSAIGTTAWTIPTIPLKSGANVITVTATNALGLTQTAMIGVAYDAVTAFKGTYMGLLTTADTTPAYFGQAKITMTGTGAFTGTIWFDGVNTPIASKFVNGTFTKMLKRTNRASLMLTMNLVPGTTTSITGSVTNGTTSGTFEALLPAYNASTNPWPRKGRYTLLLAPDPNDATAPTGHGYGLIAIDRNGSVSLVGKLADGNAISQTASLRAGGILPLFVSLYAEGGYLTGPATFSTDSTGDISGVANWIRPSMNDAVRFPAGFNTHLTLAGGAYAPPATGLTALSSGARTAEIGDGDLDQPIPKTLTLIIGDTFTVTPTGSDALHLTVTGSTGQLVGSFKDSDSGETVTLQGAVVQGSDTGAGYFLSPASAGYLDIGSSTSSGALIPAKQTPSGK